MTTDETPPPQKLLLDFRVLKGVMEGNPEQVRVIEGLMAARQAGLPVTVMTTSLQLIGAISAARPRIHAPESRCPHCQRTISRTELPITGLEGIHLIMTQVPIVTFTDFPIAVAMPLAYANEKALDTETMKFAETFSQNEPEDQQ